MHLYISFGNLCWRLCVDILGGCLEEQVAQVAPRTGEPLYQILRLFVVLVDDIQVLLDGVELFVLLGQHRGSLDSDLFSFLAQLQTPLQLLILKPQ